MILQWTKMTQGPTPHDKRPKIPPPGASRLMDLTVGPWGNSLLFIGWIRGTALSWMVFDMENPMNMDDDWGYPYDSGNHHITQLLDNEQIWTDAAGEIEP